MGYVLALAAVFFWSWNIIIASSFAYVLAPLEIAFGRWLIAGFILVALSYKSLQNSFPLLKKHWLLITGMALTGIVFDNTLIYYAGETASAVNIGLLGIIGPVFLVVLSRIFLKTPITWLQALGMLIAIFGVIVIITKGNFSGLLNMGFAMGDFIAIVNTLCFAVYSFLQSLRPKDIPQQTMLAATAIIGTLLLFISMLMFVPILQLEKINLTDIGIICYLGIFNSVIAYMAWNTALAQIGNLRAGIIYYLLPIFSGLEAYFFLHEQIGFAQIAGGAIIILGIFIVSFSQKPTVSKLNNRQK